MKVFILVILVLLLIGFYIYDLMLFRCPFCGKTSHCKHKKLIEDLTDRKEHQ